MKYGVDCLYPPMPEQAVRMRNLGWTWLAVYVGGPRAAAHSAWQEVDQLRYPVRDLAPHFDGFLPIYVGKNAPWDRPEAFTYDTGLQDGQDADDLALACGFAANTPLALDLEYGTWQAARDAVHEYVRGWVEAVNRAGHPAGLYSDMETLDQYQNRPDLIDFLWGAAWIRGGFTNSCPAGRFDPSSPPPWQVWQYAGGNIAGVQVDTNSMTDDFELARYGLE